MRSGSRQVSLSIPLKGVGLSLALKAEFTEKRPFRVMNGWVYGRESRLADYLSGFEGGMTIGNHCCSWRRQGNYSTTLQATNLDIETHEP